MKKTFLFLACTGFLSLYHVKAQVVLNAKLADTSTQSPLGNVNVQVKNSFRHTVSSDNGFFLIEIQAHDTLIFSLVGYETLIVEASEIKDRLIIYMKQKVTELKEIVVNNSGIPWLPKIPPLSPYRNQSNDPRFLNTPGFQGVQTFGPGVVVSGPISRFSKDVREKKKYQTVVKENRKSKGYAELVNEEDVKGKIMATYKLTENEYYDVLAKFNEKNKDIIYELDDNELISLLFVFFEQNHQKK